jgi:hypothetical protein
MDQIEIQVSVVEGEMALIDKHSGPIDTTLTVIITDAAKDNENDNCPSLTNVGTTWSPMRLLLRG